MYVNGVQISHDIHIQAGNTVARVTQITNIRALLLDNKAIYSGTSEPALIPVDTHTFQSQNGAVAVGQRDKKSLLAGEFTKTISTISF